MEKNIQTGKRIQIRREELRMNLGDVAKEVGVAVSTIQRYEKGKIEKIKLPVIEAIAKALRVNPAWLLVAHYREESIVKRWQQDPLWQMLTAAQKQQVASVDSNTWARMRGIFAAERIAADTVKIFHHQPLTVVK